MSSRVPSPPGPSIAELTRDRDFLLRSIEDLDREHAAGDVDDVDYAALRAGYVERAAATLRAIAALAEAREEAAGQEDPAVQDGSGAVGDARQGSAAIPSGRSRAAGGPAYRVPGALGRLRAYLGRRRSRRGLIAIGVVCALGLATVVAAHAAGIRLPGASATGSVTLTPAAEVRQELVQAQLAAGEGQLRDAISVYDTVLGQVPHQPEALALKGWFLRLAGIAAKSVATVADGDGDLAEAVRYAPGYGEARAFYGIALLEDENAGPAALVQFRAFLGDRPSGELLGSVGALMAKAFANEHVPLPPALRPFART